MAKFAMMTGTIPHTGDRSREPSTLRAWFEGIARRVSYSWAWYQDYRETAHELNGLSDRELNDIGIPRCDIPMIAAQAANDKSTQR